MSADDNDLYVIAIPSEDPGGAAFSYDAASIGKVFREARELVEEREEPVLICKVIGIMKPKPRQFSYLRREAAAELGDTGCDEVLLLETAPTESKEPA